MAQIAKDGEVERLTVEISDLHKSKCQSLELMEQRDKDTREKDGVTRATIIRHWLCRFICVHRDLREDEETEGEGLGRREGESIFLGLPWLGFLLLSWRPLTLLHTAPFGTIRKCTTSCLLRCFLCSELVFGITLVYIGYLSCLYMV